MQTYKPSPTAYGVLRVSPKMLSTVINSRRFATVDGLADAEESLNPWNMRPATEGWWALVSGFLLLKPNFPELFEKAA